ncbi:MAG: hypothetical protein DWQ44_01500 [Bacteroidetes bacterium]|nr:MAG: hypothetical protein DWQ33_05230 [Bacteroidota bacterium]REK04655.1 MAG: hypothetical protein DWQ39_05390 [Bacteroidota bacterium]REK36130.1 MAG: hypothetical protein DWQ44_01500 [Bacteroidota bacterium]
MRLQHRLFSICILVLLNLTNRNCFAINTEFEYTFKHFNVDHGLLSSTIYQIIKDKNGFIWISTSGGVNRFDGTNFEKFTIDDGLSDNEVTGLFEDSKGRIWFLTINGRLSYYYNGIFHNTENDTILAKTIANSNYLRVHEDRTGNLWFVSNTSGIVTINIDNSVDRYDSEPDLSLTDPNKGLYSFMLFESSQGAIYAYGLQTMKDGIMKAICIRNCKTDSEHPVDEYVFSHHIADTRLALAEKGRALYLSDKGIVEIRDKKEELIIPYNKEIRFNNITNFQFALNGNINLSTQNAAYKFNKVGDKYEPELLISGKIISNLYIDDEENYWIGTAGAGLYLMPRKYRYWKHIGIKQGLKNEEIYSLIRVGDTIWAGTNQGKMSLISNQKVIGNYNVFTSKNQYNRIRQICLDRDNNFWFVGDVGLATFTYRKPETLKTIPLFIAHDQPLVNSYASKYLSPDTTGNMYATYFLGVLIPDTISVRNVRQRVFRRMETKNEARSFAHHFDPKNNFWISNVNGLYIIDSMGKKRWLDRINKVVKSRVVDFLSLNDSVKIISTEGQGIFILNHEDVAASYSIKSGLPSNLCRRARIYEDKIFICTNAGLVRAKWNQMSLEITDIYDVQVGLISSDIYDILVYQDSMYIATSQGISIGPLDFNQESIDPPHTHILAIYSDDQMFKHNQVVIFNPGTSHLIIKFVGIAYQNPKSVLYKYALVSNDTIWHQTSHTQAEFSDLPPGEYTFLVQSKRANSNWSEIESLKFELKPLTHETAWFKGIIIASICASLFFLARLIYTRRLQKQIMVLKQKEAIETERMRIATDMHDDLGSDLTKISILSNIIIREKERGIGNIAVPVGKISSLSYGVLKRMDEIIWALNPSHDTTKGFLSYLRSYIMETAESVETKIQFIGPDDIPDKPMSSTIRRSIYLIVKESLNNSIKHSKSDFITISVSWENSELVILIMDKGVGFSPGTVKIKGNGLGNMQKRAQEIKAAYSIDSIPGSGTTTRISYKF